MLSVGHWKDATTGRFTRLVNSQSIRRRFIKNVVNFLKERQFQGLHLNWNWPKCWVETCQMGTTCEIRNYKKFIKELRTAFKHDLKLAVSIPASTEILREGYDLYNFHKNIDYLLVRTFPMVRPERQNFDVTNALELISKCCNPPSKIVIDIPIYTLGINRTEDCLEVNTTTSSLIRRISLTDVCSKISYGWNLNENTSVISGEETCIKYRNLKQIKKQVRFLIRSIKPTFHNHLGADRVFELPYVCNYYLRGTM